MPKTVFKRCLNKLVYGLALNVADFGAFGWQENLLRRVTKGLVAMSLLDAYLLR